MNSLFFVNENFISGYITEMLNIFSLLIILCGILVIITKNPIISVLFLIGLFSGVASYLILLGINFIGLAYLIVYIGAVSILFLFILMLINIRVSELQNNTSNSLPLAIIIGVLFNFSLFQSLPYDMAILNNNYNYNYINNFFYSFSLNNYNYKNFKVNNNDILFATSNMWDGNITELDHITSIGNIMYSNYNIWLIITSYILLLAMIGAIIITIKQKN